MEVTVTEAPPPEVALLPAIAVRPATESDKEGFLDLVFAYLEEVHSMGGDLLPTPGNVESYGNLFDSILRDQTAGIVMVASINEVAVGFSMATELKSPLEMAYGRAALGWGTFVTPILRGRGIARDLRMWIDANLRSLGFDCVVGGYHPGNEIAAASLVSTGFEVFQHLGIKRLRGEE